MIKLKKDLAYNSCVLHCVAKLNRSNILVNLIRAHEPVSQLKRPIH